MKSLKKSKLVHISYILHISINTLYIITNIIVLGTKCEYRHVFIIMAHKKNEKKGTKIYFFIN